MNRIAVVSIAVLASTCAFAGVAKTKDQTYEGPKVVVEKETVIISDVAPAAYLLVSHDEQGKIFDTRMVYGDEAVGDIAGASTATVDVYRVDALGSLHGGQFKPCTPVADQPDCTPTGGFPPIVPPRFKLLDILLD